MPSDTTNAPLGIIAGNRQLPLILADAAREQGVECLVAAAFHGETDPALESRVDHIEWLRVGQLAKLIQAFKKHDVHRCVMVGQIAPDNLFQLRPDLKAMKLLWSLKERNAHTLFGGIADALAAEGIDLIPSTPWLTALIPGSDYHCGKPLTDAQRQDIAFGARITRTVSDLEIGQCTVVKEGTVLAVEGFEGTDECLLRGGKLAGKKGGAVSVKLPKPDQDPRFDIPCIGLTTIERCAEAKIAVLAFETDRTYLIDRPAIESTAKRHRITLTSLPSPA